MLILPYLNYPHSGAITIDALKLYNAVRDLELRHYGLTPKVIESTDNSNPLKPARHIANVTSRALFIIYSCSNILHSN